MKKNILLFPCYLFLVHGRAREEVQEEGKGTDKSIMSVTSLTSFHTNSTISVFFCLCLFCHVWRSSHLGTAALSCHKHTQPNSHTRWQLV